MRPGAFLAQTLSLTLAVFTAAGRGHAADTGPGYLTNYTTLPGNDTFSFGQHYAVLNLDLIVGIVGSVSNTAQGQQFIASTSKWIDVVHAQTPPPLSIFTRIYSVNAQHVDIAGGFSKVFTFEPGTIDDPNTQLYPAFVPVGGDVVLQKIRYYAGTANELELILSSQKIDTVILSGIRSSGVILSTAYRLFDLNYNVYVIADNVIESAPDTPSINQAILEGIIPKLPANVITLDQAIAALGRSGPAIY